MIGSYLWFCRVLFVARGPRVRTAPGLPCALFGYRGQMTRHHSGADAPRERSTMSAHRHCEEQSKATKQSRLSPRRHSGLLRFARNDGDTDGTISIACFKIEMHPVLDCHRPRRRTIQYPRGLSISSRRHGLLDPPLTLIEKQASRAHPILTPRTPHPQSLADRRRTRAWRGSDRCPARARAPARLCSAAARWRWDRPSEQANAWP